MKTKRRTPSRSRSGQRDLGRRLAEAEKELAALRSGSADEAYRMMVEQMSEGALIMGRDGTVLYCNLHFAEMLRAPLEQVIGSAIESHLEPALVPAFKSLLAAAAKAAAKGEVILRRGDASGFPALLSLSPLTGYGLPAVTMLATDLTQERAREELVASERLARGIVEQSVEPIIVCDEGGRIIQASIGAKSLYEGDPTLQLFEEAFPLSLEPGQVNSEHSNRVCCQGTVVSGLEVRFQSRSGKEHVLLASSNPTTDAQNRISGSKISLADITDRKRVEKIVRDANAQLESKVSERTAQLTAANKELEAFNYSVSHDLRAPLRSIAGFSEALRTGYPDKLDEIGKDYLRRIEGSIKRMSALIDAMMLLSRTTLKELVREETDLSALASSIGSELRARQPERQFKLTVEPGMKADGDRVLIEIALRCLIENAWKFTAGSPEAAIWVATVPGETSPVIFVRDNGVGFEQAYADKIFLPFQRLHTKEQFPGTGIGLTLVSRIAQRHGGRAWAKSEPGKGATFYLTLGPGSTGPRRQAAPEQRVLLVEDDRDDRELALLAFKTGGFPYPVDAANDGAEALEHLRVAQALPILIVLDLNLPKIGGLEVLARVRSDPRLKDLLVVVLTGADEPRDKREVEKWGVARYLRKPLGLQGYVELVRDLKDLLRENSGIRP